MGAGSLAAPGPSPADGAASAPSRRCEAPTDRTGPGSAQSPRKAVSPWPCVPPGLGEAGTEEGHGGGRGRGRTHYVSRSSSAAVVREPGVRLGVGCWRERMPCSDGHSPRWAIAPGLLGISYRSWAGCHQPAPRAEDRGHLHLATGPFRRQLSRTGLGSGDIVGPIEPYCPLHPQCGRLHTGRFCRCPSSFLAKGRTPLGPEAGGRGRPAARFSVPRFSAVPERPSGAGRAECAVPGLRAAGRLQSCCDRRVPRTRQRSAPGASPKHFQSGLGSGRALPVGRTFSEVINAPFLLTRVAPTALPPQPSLQPATSWGHARRPPRPGPELPGVSVSRLRSGFAGSRSSRGGKRPPVGGGAAVKRKLGADGAAAGQRTPSRGG